jgi:hypothetical protein
MFAWAHDKHTLLASRFLVGMSQVWRTWVLDSPIRSYRYTVAMFPLPYNKCTLKPQSALVVYAPIWVDEFAPPDACTLWMSLMQAGVPLGVMAGYLVRARLLGGDFF